MPEHFYCRVELTQSQPLHLLLFPTHPIDPTGPFVVADPFAQFTAWLRSFNEMSKIQPEQGADWFQIRFYFQMQPFCLHYEHYSDCYWIDADSQASLVLLSTLAEFIASFEYNHRLSQP